MDNQTTWFCLDKDNVLFRGFDSGRKFDGYVCPLFEYRIASAVANYVTTELLKVRFDGNVGSFTVIKGGDVVVLRKYKKVKDGVIGEGFLYEFSGWPWVKISQP